MYSLYLPFFFFIATATTEIYTLSLHDALPICRYRRATRPGPPAPPGGRGSPAPRRPGPSVVARSADRKSTRLNSSHGSISYAVFCLKKKKEAARQYLHTRGTRQGRYAVLIILSVDLLSFDLVVLISIHVLSLFAFFFFYCYGDHRDLHSFPTRRSSDLSISASDATRSASATGRSRISSAPSARSISCSEVR